MPPLFAPLFEMRLRGRFRSKFSWRFTSNRVISSNNFEVRPSLAPFSSRKLQMWFPDSRKVEDIDITKAAVSHSNGEELKDSVGSMNGTHLRRILDVKFFQTECGKNQDTVFHKR